MALLVSPFWGTRVWRAMPLVRPFAPCPMPLCCLSCSGCIPSPGPVFVCLFGCVPTCGRSDIRPYSAMKLFTYTYKSHSSSTVERCVCPTATAPLAALLRQLQRRTASTYIRTSSLHLFSYVQNSWHPPGRSDQMYVWVERSKYGCTQNTLPFFFLQRVVSLHRKWSKSLTASRTGGVQ